MGVGGGESSSKGRNSGVGGASESSSQVLEWVVGISRFATFKIANFSESYETFVLFVLCSEIFNS